MLNRAPVNEEVGVVGEPSVLIVAQRAAQLRCINPPVAVGIKRFKHPPPILLATLDMKREECVVHTRR